jgi:hypothetical protein
VWAELERRGATVAVVPFSGRAGLGGETGTITLSGFAGDELVVERWTGRDELAFAPEGPCVGPLWPVRRPSLDPSHVVGR